VEPSCSFAEVLQRASRADLPIFCYEGDGTLPLKTLLREPIRALGGKIPTISIVVGSEGGFSLKEAAMAKDMGFLMAGLGQRILRTETAASFVLSALVYELEL
jgi:16S rRNA (uracil1498-N3)-methyltransferase